jgi:energy-coupling factor transporter ATP-binding protein EcfA2
MRAPPDRPPRRIAVLPEIIQWSRERPLWQQDALRRLAEQPRLTADDHEALVALCKTEFGIAVEGTPPARTLSTDGVVGQTGGAHAVRLTRVHSVRNVNALRDDQSLTVAPAGLTVVYGDNGAGKSGYVRVLKQVCRARGAKDAVHPNIYAETASPASAVVGYEVASTAVAPAQTGGSTATGFEAEWGPGVVGPADLAQISVFDSRSAAVYVTDQNDVAYLPHGTDLFPKLVGVAEAVKSALEQEIAGLERQRDRFDTIPAGTRIFDVLDNLHVAGARARVDAFAALTDADHSRLEELRGEDRRLKADDPIGKAQELRRCAARLQSARERLVRLEAALDHSAISGLREAREALSTARAAAELASGGAFADAPVGGVGSETWRALWEAARSFAQADAIPPQAFPVGNVGDARCVLCQQPLEGDAQDRMQRFEEFVRGETRASLDRASRELEARIQALHVLAPHDLADEVLLNEIESLDAELAAILTDCTTTLARRREEALIAVRADETPDDWAALAHAPSGGSDRLQALALRVTADAARFEAGADPAARKAVADALREMEARVALAGLRERAYAEIARQECKAKLRKCVASANTAPITKRNTELLRDAVSQPLADEFAAQIGALDLRHLPVTVAASHGQKGKAYHGLALDKKTKAKIPTQDVLSEGEHRGVALAAFFAEVSLQDSESTIVFDDPVSSMDHGRRGYVANRVVEIARTRPVLVFTHDLVFLWMLQRAAKGRSVALAPRYFRRDDEGAGLITEEWPWDGQSVSTRIGQLKQAVAGFPKLAATSPAKYETEVRTFYGKLRETWERSVEEVLFNGALRRFSPEIQTLRLKNLHRLTEQHMTDFEAGMTKASAWIRGHDHATELALPVPEPVEVTADLDALDRWVKDVKRHHEGKKG